MHNNKLTADILLLLGYLIGALAYYLAGKQAQREQKRQRGW